MNTKKPFYGVRKMISDLYPYIWPHKKWLLLSASVALLLIIFNMFKAYFTGSIVALAISKDTATLYTSVLIFGALLSLGIPLAYFSVFANEQFAISTARDMQKALTQKLLHMPVVKIEQFGRGDILSRFNVEINVVTDFIGNSFKGTFYNPLLFVATSIYMAKLSWQLYVASYILLPFCSYIIHVLGKMSANYGRRFYEKSSDAANLMMASINSIVTIKAYNSESYMLQKCRQGFDLAIEQALKREMCDSVSLPIWFMNRQLSRIICTVYGGYLAVTGQLSLEALLICITLAGYVAAPASAMLSVLQGVHRARVAMERLASLTHFAPEPFDIADGQGTTYEVTHRIDLNEVTFAYPGNGQTLKGASLSIPGNGLYALVGRSGEGKSTVMNMLLGFLHAQGGQILFNSRDAYNLPLARRRQMISYVPQDITLFSGTVGENIAYGKRNATFTEVVSASEMAGAHEFITALPQGYDTLTGEDGVLLSGGQKQRIAIARAIIKGAPIILMDEPVAAIDARSESIVGETLLKLSRKHVVFVSAHRLDMIEQADRIFVLDKGRIVEQGTHHELLSNADSLYSNLYHTGQSPPQEVIGYA